LECAPLCLYLECVMRTTNVQDAPSGGTWKGEVHMDWRWLLLARYQGQPMIRAEVVCSDYFSPLTFKAWKEMVHDGTIQMPIMRMSPSKKAPLYISINHLADFLARREADAAREARALSR
jgi:hypothetical protein